MSGFLCIILRKYIIFLMVPIRYNLFDLIRSISFGLIGTALLPTDRYARADVSADLDLLHNILEAQAFGVRVGLCRAA